MRASNIYGRKEKISYNLIYNNEDVEEFAKFLDTIGNPYSYSEESKGYNSRQEVYVFFEEPINALKTVNLLNMHIKNFKIEVDEDMQLRTLTIEMNPQENYSNDFKIFSTYIKKHKAFQRRYDKIELPSKNNY